MNELTKDQIFQDVVKQAEEYAREEGITNPGIVQHIMEGIRIGMARGLEIAQAVYNRPNEELQRELDEIPF